MPSKQLVLEMICRLFYIDIVCMPDMFARVQSFTELLRRVVAHCQPFLWVEAHVHNSCCISCL